MGDFRIVINAVGGHGQDRGKKDGEIVDFTIDGEYAPEAMAERFVNDLMCWGVNIQDAKVIHWPIDNYEGRTSEIVDDLLTGVRKGNF